jgi:DNA invertase Pin-like site-specific DNA recombinase
LGKDLVSHGGFIAYYRVSTSKQSRSGLGIEAQRAAVANYLNGGKWRIVGEFTEVESGRRSDRPELERALAAARVRRVEERGGWTASRLLRLLQLKGGRVHLDLKD